MFDEKIQEVLEGRLKDWFPTGSNYICNPPVTDTDIDIMLYVTDKTETSNALLDLGNAVLNYDDLYIDQPFLSVRYGKYNFLITDEVMYFADFKFATEVAKKLNLKNKTDRIVLFDAILYEIITK